MKTIHHKKKIESVFRDLQFLTSIIFNYFLTSGHVRLYLRSICNEFDIRTNRFITN